jgi:hypothetical protein
MKKYVLLIFIILNSFSSALAQKKVYVDAGNIDKPIFILDGTSWFLAYSSLQYALEKNVGIENIEYHIAKGHFKFSENSFFATKGSFYGGYKPGGSDLPDKEQYPVIIENGAFSFELKSIGTQYIKDIFFAATDLEVVSSKVNRGNESILSKKGLPIVFSGCHFYGALFDSKIGDVTLTSRSLRTQFSKPSVRRT